MAGAPPIGLLGRSLRHWRYPLVLGAIVLALLLVWEVGELKREQLLQELEQQGLQELDLYVSYLNGQLDRFDFLPALLADDQRLRRLLENSDDPELQREANEFLAYVNRIAGAMDVYLMDARGLTLAASNWRDPVTFIGKNFAFRPYFDQARKGGPGRYFALGTTSGRRGYYFSYPVLEHGQTRGVVAVKLDIETFEDDWRNRISDLVVADPDGVVFISTREQWRYKTLNALEPATLAQIRASRRYPDTALQPIGLVEHGLRPSGSRLLSGPPRQGARYLSMRVDMPDAGWQVQLLVSLQTIQDQTLQVRIFTAVFLLLGGLVLMSFGQRRVRRLARDEGRRQAMQEALVQMEERVAQRTAALTKANRRLRHEVQRHEQTRDELIQAAKMAALGQMSAGINHELNQPLAAMRGYADNARIYLQRGRYTEAEDNLAQIVELTERMALISSQFKVFSRRTSGQRVCISLRACLNDALRILQPRIRQSGAEVVVELADEDLFVAADLVQLEQVFVNLIGNACNAVEQAIVRRVEVAAVADDAWVRVDVRDTGRGIAAENLPRIFDPFFTTSDTGLGLGLSISHTIVERMQGQLTAASDSRGGAVFSVRLQAWREALG